MCNELDVRFTNTAVANGRLKQKNPPYSQNNLKRCGLRCTMHRELHTDVDDNDFKTPSLIVPHTDKIHTRIPDKRKK